MPTDIVVDSSVVVAIVTPEEHSEWATKTTQEHEYLHLLDLSFYEVANVITNKTTEKFNKEDAATAYKNAEKIMQLYTIHNFSEIVTDALDKALELDITVYDAAFLTLAEKLNTHLLTLDLKLAKKLENTKYSRLIQTPNKK